jgi:hypothetical protein
MTPSAFTQGDFTAAGFERLRELLGDIKCDGHGPQSSVRQPHVVTDAFVIGAIQEAAQGREAATQQQFHIAHLARPQVPRRPFLGVRCEFRSPIRFDDKVDKDPAVRGN